MKGQSMYKQTFVTIEGNIGGGKSTMINLLRQQYPDVVIIDEPVDQWLGMKDADTGKSLLQLFYEDKQRWSYTFQNCAFITRYLSAFQALSKPIEKDTIYISERGILTDRYVFATMLRESGCLTSIEWDLYTKWFGQFSNTAKPNAIIYITTDSNVCSNRIKQRNREGEEGIPQAYLDDLEAAHETWLATSDIPVLRVSSDPENAKVIMNFVQSL